ncbi:predicted protein [Uncinocarpus reesii 1704]|uniref:Major facilitator superfamily (MFS) profile domain-containing protein n=1 Tax=Uncinocarpus reesii (strain UAMH 1704) TaxID=336963 RepID=C4JJA4_UNCRE|nr:uncharacterized protein UREG_01711 [Uncinocarpus reesii 1704]EEP76862.1 predicted protein [Uncinocarpus reesii 1704]
MATESTSPPSGPELSHLSLEDDHNEKSPITTDDQDQAPAGDFPDGGTRAWAVALGTAGIAFCTLGYVNSFGVYQAYYESSQLRGHSPSQISWIGSTQAFFVFGGGIVGGPLFDLYGAKVIRPAALLFVLSIMLTSVCTEYYQFILAQGILGGLSNGMSMFPAMAAAPQYFDKKRAAAMGIGIAGSSLGGIIWPIALSKMLTSTNLGFGWSVRITGFVALALIAPSAFAVKARLPPRKSRFFLWESFKEPPFICLVIAGFLGFLGLFTPLFYLPVYAIQQGMSPYLAFYLAAIFNGASFLGRVIPGILADKLGRFNVFISATVSSGILTFCWPRVHSNAALIVFGSIFGFCSGAITSGMAVSFTSIPKDPRNIGTYMGVSF